MTATAVHPSLRQIKLRGGITKWVKEPQPQAPTAPVSSKPVLMRDALGAVLRELRKEQRLTLRDVASQAAMAIGYLSEVERGKKEVSSEMLAPLCAALGTSVPSLLIDVALHMQPVPAAPSAPTTPATSTRIENSYV